METIVYVLRMLFGYLLREKKNFFLLFRRINDNDNR
jgi:hypothetical protein